MRVFLIRSVLILVFVILLLATSAVALATFGLTHPGNLVFPIQNFAEQQFRLIYPEPTREASYLLDLADRRVGDLVLRAGSGDELIAMEYLEKAIDQVSLAISDIPAEKSSALRTRLIFVVKRSIETFNQLKRVPIENQAAYSLFSAKLQSIQHMIGTNNAPNNELVLVSAMAQDGLTNKTSQPKMINSASGLIPWPPGSQGVIHAFYPLIGTHITTPCVACHNEGIYFGTPNQCMTCHYLKTPTPHYVGDCGLCHTPISWKDIHFDHSTVADMACSTCHEKDIPLNHYHGECSACHITQNWTTVNFNHAVAGAVDCTSCHSKDAPSNHYPGQCSNCHNTSNWTSVVFDHTGFTDCVACHAKEAPAGHYPGQCSNCHSTSGGWKNAHFNHSGFTDCISCHANNAPANHYPGQCSNCHNTGSWQGAVFNHAGFTDCISCHLKDRPAEHDAGQCSNCHTTQNWSTGGNNANLGIIITSNSVYVSCAACHSSSAMVQAGKIGQ